MSLTQSMTPAFFLSFSLLMVPALSTTSAELAPSAPSTPFALFVPSMPAALSALSTENAMIEPFLQSASPMSYLPSAQFTSLALSAPSALSASTATYVSRVPSAYLLHSLLLRQLCHLRHLQYAHHLQHAQCSFQLHGQELQRRSCCNCYWYHSCHPHRIQCLCRSLQLLYSDASAICDVPNVLDVCVVRFICMTCIFLTFNIVFQVQSRAQIAQFVLIDPATFSAMLSRYNPSFVFFLIHTEQ